MQERLPTQVLVTGELLRWVALGGLVGVVAGASSAGFLVTLDWATTTRIDHPALVWFLPGAGLLLGLVLHHRSGVLTGGGNTLILDEIHEPRAWIPRRLALFVYVGTVVTHLFGGSAGREGTAVQMAGSLTDGCSRLLRLRPADRRIMLIAALAGGFGAVFGVPIAGCVFGLEVQSVGRIRYDAIVPALVASVVGDRLVRGLGVHHLATPHLEPVSLDAALFAKVLLAGCAFGLASVVFVAVVRRVRATLTRIVRWPPLRPAVGGAAVVALTLVTGTHAYLGLSLPLITEAFAGGEALPPAAFALKLVFTAVTLGAGFPGGEVTPLFVIGATLGAVLGLALGVPVPLLAALGFVCVFASAANVPLTGTILGVELFGGDVVLLFAVACVAGYVCSSHEGIYAAQRIDTPKHRHPESEGRRRSAWTEEHRKPRREARGAERTEEGGAGKPPTGAA